jgi:hypothetical protein
MPAALVPITVYTTTSVAPRTAFETGVHLDLTKIFTGFGLLPAVVGTREQTGPWDHVGASRKPVLSDGTTAFEQITPYEFLAYYCSDLRMVRSRTSASG